MTIEESIKQQIRYVVKRNIRAIRIKNTINVNKLAINVGTVNIISASSIILCIESQSLIVLTTIRFPFTLSTLMRTPGSIKRPSETTS